LVSGFHDSESAAPLFYFGEIERLGKQVKRLEAKKA
jgi:hypothetical protein